MDYSKESDELLLSLLKQQDHEAFSELYHRYSKPLYIHIYKILRDEHEAGDVLQNVFTALWKNAGKIEITFSLKSYLYKMTRNFTLNAIQKSKVRQKHIDSFASFLEGHISHTNEVIHYNELKANFQQELLEMGPRMREVFVKCRLEGTSYKEVAVEMGITENTVKTVLHRATRILRGRLSLFPLFLNAISIFNFC